MQAETRTCQNCKNQFTIESEDFDFYKKIAVPPPTFCPSCRRQRRLAWRNDLNLYSRACDLCKKSIISIYSTDKPFPVYCQKCWWSDDWDPKRYAQVYDPSKNFFVQFKELQSRVPALAMVNDDGIASVNCEYTQDFAFAKNCYMSFIGWKAEDCAYCYYVVSGKNMVDCLDSMGGSQFTYENIYTEKCYQCTWAYYSIALSDCHFCYDCQDCSDCFMCVGLRHKQYCFKNQQYSKEEYEKILEEYQLGTYSGVERAKKEFEPLLSRYPRRFSVMRNCVHCTGNCLLNGKNSKFCFNVQRPEDSKYVQNSDTPKESYDLLVGGELNQCYEGITPDHSYRGLFTMFSWKNSEVFYVDACHSSKYLFGCCGIKKGQHCILNREYSKEEYEALLPKIKKDMERMLYADKQGNVYPFGEFFPVSLSNFAYNESAAQDYFPLTREETLSQRYSWQDNLQITMGKSTMNAEKIPDGIVDVKPSIIEEVLSCSECKRNYRITRAELEFYRHLKIPIPRKCFYCRHKARLNFRNPHTLWHRACTCGGGQSENAVYKNTAVHFHGTGHCPNEFETSYVPGRPEIVYCEQCYQAEVA